MLRFLADLLPATPTPRAAVDSARAHWAAAEEAATWREQDGDDEEEAAAEIARRLKLMLRDIADEEDGAKAPEAAAARAGTPPRRGAAGRTTTVMRGPCLELMLEARVPEALAGWAQADRPTGVRDVALGFFTALLTSVRQPLLPEHAVRGALTALIASCARLRLLDDPAQHATHLALVELLVTVVRRLVEQPVLLPLFFQSSPTRASFPVFTTLLEYVDCSGRLGLMAREGVLLTELLSHPSHDSTTSGEAVREPPSPAGALADYIVNDSAAPQLVAAKLAELYCSLPSVPPNDGDADAVRGNRTLAAFLDLLKFADQLVQQAGEGGALAVAIGAAVDTTVLRRLVREALMQPTEDAALTATWHMVHALHTIETDTLAHVFAAFLVGPADADAADPLGLELVRRIDSLSRRLSLATIALFDALLGLYQPEPILHLVLRRPPLHAADTGSRTDPPDTVRLRRNATAADVFDQVGRFLTITPDALDLPEDDGGAPGPRLPDPDSATPAPPALPARRSNEADGARSPPAKHPPTRPARTASPAAPPQVPSTQAATPDSASPALPTLADARTFASSFLHFVLTGDVSEDEEEPEADVPSSPREREGRDPPAKPARRTGAGPIAPAPATAHDCYYADAQDAQHEYFRRMLQWPPLSAAAIAVGEEAAAVTADGPLLCMLLDSTAQLADMPFNQALLLTACLAKLAQWTWPPSLHRQLLVPDAANPSGLYAVLLRVAAELGDRVARAPNRTRLRASLIRHRTEPNPDVMDVGDADPLLLSCILLDELCKELAAILLAKSAEAAETVNPVVHDAAADGDPITHNMSTL